jgi:hypothetical protein
MLKSHKPKRVTVGGEDDIEESAPRRHRKMTLAQLEQRVKRRKSATGKGGIMSRLNNIMKNTGPALQRMNRGMNKSTRSMPSEKDVNKMLWG